MFGIGMTELLVILAIVLVIFGANKLPEIVPEKILSSRGSEGCY